MNVSVIIPAYNAALCIEKALLSVLAQNVALKLEVIIVNDGSSDNTSNVVKRFIDNNNKLASFIFIEQDNKGVATARNVGVDQASNEWLAFLDSDDTWNPDKLSAQIKFLTANPSVSLVAGNFNGLNANFKKLEQLDKCTYLVTFKNLLKKHYFQPSTVLMKKSVFHDVGGFKDGMTHGEEGLLFYNVCYTYECAISSSIVINYGDDKHPFASQEGLASNLLKMEMSELSNYHQIYRLGMINNREYSMLTLFSIIKYVRRVVIRWINNVK